MLRFYVSFICPFFTLMYSQRLNRAIHRPIFSRLAGAQFADCITCLAISHFVSVCAYSCLSASSIVSHIYTFFSLNMSEYVSFLRYIHLPFLHPSVPIARLGRAIRHQIFSCLAGAQFADCMTWLTNMHFLLVCIDYQNFASLLIFLSLNMSVYASFPCFISLQPYMLP